MTKGSAIMNREKFGAFWVLFIFSLFGGIAVFFSLVTELKLGLAIIASFLIFLLFLLLIGFKKILILPVTKLGFIAPLVFPLLYSLSLLAIMVIPSIDSQIMLWESIPIANYFRLFSSLLVAFVFPGFAIIKLVCKEKLLSFPESLVFSYVISLLVTSLFGVNFVLLLVVNLILLMSSFYVILKEKLFSTTSTIKVNIIKVGILLCLFLLFSLSIIPILSNYWLAIGPDIWRHYSWMVNIMKGILDIPLVPRTFNILYAAYFQISGFPFINARIMSIPLLFMTVVSFYLMASAYLGKIDKRAPMISTIIWAFFSGFGWIYAISLRFTTEMSWLEVLRTTLAITHLDIGYPPGYWIFMGDNPPAAIGFTALFLLLYLVRKTDFSYKSLFILCTATFMAGYLLHSVEVMFFFVIIPFLIILKNRICIKDLLLSIVSACVIIIAYDFGYQCIYVGGFVATTLFRYACYILFASLTGYITTYIIPRISPRLCIKRFPQISVIIKKSTMLTIIVTILIYLYGFSLLTWIETNDVYTWWLAAPYRFVPWHIYPIVLGTAGIFFIIALALSHTIFKKYKDVFIFLVVSFIFFFLAGRLISFININYFNIGFNESRVLSFLYIPLAMLASISIMHIFEKITNIHKCQERTHLRKRLISGLIFFIILTSGLLSTLMTIEYWTLHIENHPNNISFEELSAMEYLRLNTNPAALGTNLADYELVFTFTDVSHQTLQTFSGTGSYSFYSYKGNILFNAKQSDQPLYFFNTYQTNYLYLAQRDYEQLSQIPDSFLGQYLQFFPKSFENEEATIYEIPSLSAPTLNSENAIILPTNHSTSYPNALLMFAKALYNYTIVLDSDAGLLNRTVLVLPFDPRTPAPAFFDDTFTSGWEKVSEDLTSISDGNILELSYDNKDNSTVWISYERQFPKTIDASTYKYLVWRVFIEEMAEDIDSSDYAGIRLYDDNAKSWFWVGAVSLTRQDCHLLRKDYWFDVTFDAQNNLWHKFENISKMQIVLRVSPDSTQKIKTDSITLYKDLTFVYDPNLSSELIQWVENGGLLLVINGDGLMGDFSDILNLKEANDNFKAKEVEANTTTISIPQIEVAPILLKEPTVEIFASYRSEENESPFALYKTMGKGKIVYLFAEPYFSAMENAVVDYERVQLFSKMGSLLEIIDLPISLQENVSTKKYETAIREANLLGYTTIYSDYVILPEDIEISELLVNSTDVLDIQFNDSKQVLLSDIKAYGDVDWVVNTKNANITSEGLGLYSKMSIGEEFEVILDICSNSSINLKIQDTKTGNITSHTFTNADTLKFKVKNKHPIELLIRAPHIHTNGTTNLEGFYLETIVYDYEGNSVIITGPLSFSIGFSDTFTLISDFKTDDNTTIEVVKSGKIWNEWNDVPWTNILTSTQHILLILIIILLVPHIKNLVKTEKSEASKK